jgi:outer membrane cobalamin receptor
MHRTSGSTSISGHIDMQLQKRTTLWLSLSLAFFAISAGQSAFAQDTKKVDSASTAADAEELDAVIVTGSRIKRAGYDTLEPAVTIGEEYIKSRAITNIADAINELPGFGTAVTPEGGQASFGTGVNFVNRFGLGSNRTLTLVNGRRSVTANPLTIFAGAAPGNQVDLNGIPTQLIDRVENLAVGGAPTYGSDAIAGVVNVILKNDYEGAEVALTYGMSDRGDNDRINVNGIWGTSFGEGRGNFTMSASFDNTDGVLQTQRELFRRALLFATNPLVSALTGQPTRTPQNDGRVYGTPFNTSTTDGISNAVLIQNRRLSQLTGGGLLFPSTGALNLTGGTLRGFGTSQNTYLQFDNSGSLVSYNPGIPFGNTDASGGDGFYLVESGQITSDLERETVNVFGNFDLTDSVRTFWEGSLFQSEGLEIIDQPIFNATQFGGNSAALTFSATDPRLTSQAAATLAANGITSFRLSRASRDLVTNNAKSKSKTGRLVAGLSGDFDAMDRAFNWETSLTYGRNSSEYSQNVLNQQNFLNAINVVRNAAGQIVCNPAGTIGVVAGGLTPRADANCRPLDIFGENRASAEARNYVTGRTLTDGLLEQTVFNANIGTDLFSTWAGPVSSNFGVEYRKESGKFTPNEFQRLGQGRAVAILGLEGDYNTKEIFGEFILPLVSDSNEIWGVHKFDLTAKGRRVDNSVNGNFNAWTLGAQFQPIEGFEIRANKTRSFRAPGLVELYAPTSSAFFAVNDPCDPRFVTGGTRPAIRQANCAQFYREYNLNPATFQSNAVSATVEGSSSGDANLQNELADSKTIGFVWQPEFIKNFRMSMDYYEINVRNAIAFLGANDLATGCFDNTSFAAGPVRNANSFCERINRDAAGQIVPTINADGTRTPAVRTGYVNGAFLNYQGISLEAAYNIELTDLDSLQFSMNSSNIDKLENSNNAIVTDVQDNEIGNSHLQHSFGVDYVHGPFGINLKANFISSAKFDVTFTPENRDQLSVASNTTYNLGLYFQVNDNFALRGSITNLTDKEPPFGTTGIGVYDILGRRSAISGEYRF